MSQLEDKLTALEDLATETIGRGAAISLDELSKGWKGTVWNASGDEVVSLSQSTKMKTIRGLLVLLQNRDSVHDQDDDGSWLDE